MVDSAGTGVDAWLRCQCDGPGPSVEAELAEVFAQRDDRVLPGGEVKLAGTRGPRLPGDRACFTAGPEESDMAVHPGLGATRGGRHGSALSGPPRVPR